jgi:hypothetical protein
MSLLPPTPQRFPNNLDATEEHNIINAVKVHYIPNKSCSSLISMGVRFRCGAQDSKEFRLNFLAVISFSATKIKIQVKKVMVMAVTISLVKNGGKGEVK